MTTTENLDLREEMANAIGCFGEALEHLADNQLDEAIRLWEAGKQQARMVKIKLVRVKNNGAIK